MLGRVLDLKSVVIRKQGKGRTKMRQVRDPLDLALLHQGKRGFILNDRTDGSRLHHADCDSVAAMYAAANEKIFFEDWDEAIAWSNQNNRGWQACGRCGTREV